MLDFGDVMDCHSSTASLAGVFFLASCVHVFLGEITFLEIEVRRVDLHYFSEEDIFDLLSILHRISKQKAPWLVIMSMQVHVEEESLIFVKILNQLTNCKDGWLSCF